MDAQKTLVSVVLVAAVAAILGGTGRGPAPVQQSGPARRRADCTKAVDRQAGPAWPCVLPSAAGDWQSQSGKPASWLRQASLLVAGPGRFPSAPATDCPGVPAAAAPGTTLAAGGPGPMAAPALVTLEEVEAIGEYALAMPETRAETIGKLWIASIRTGAEVRARALVLLAALGDVRGREAWRAGALADPDPAVRRALAAQVPPGLEADEDVRRLWVRMSEADTDAEVRRVASETIWFGRP